MDNIQRLEEQEDKFKTPTGRRKKSLLDVVYGKEFVDELRRNMLKEEREATND